MDETLLMITFQNCWVAKTICAKITAWYMVIPPSLRIHDKIGGILNVMDVMVMENSSMHIKGG